MSGESTALRKTRFAQIPEWVVKHHLVMRHPSVLATYAQLALLADFKTRVTTSDWKEITAITGWSERTVMRSMKVLRDAGAVIRIGSELVLPMDEKPTDRNGSSSNPDDKSDTADRHICHKSVTDLSSAPLSTENSEFFSEGEIPVPIPESEIAEWRAALTASGHSS